MILNLSKVNHIYVITGATDFRKGMMSLAALVRDTYNLDPFSDSVFLFSNKRHHSLRILHWDLNGFELYSKTIHNDMKYQWPRNEEEAKQITYQQLQWLLEGLSIEQQKAFTEVKQRIF